MTHIHPAAPALAREVADGTLSRREFLTRATALGVAAPAAYALLGLNAPAVAQQAIPAQGGTLRMQMSVRAIKDPRTADWSEIGNLLRGPLDYMVQYNNDGTFTPMLLEAWEVNEDATEYVLRVRPGVTWSNGEAFTASDVARTFEYWCDSEVEGNTMASRLSVLVDEATGALIEGSVEVVDDLTVRLYLPRPDITIIPSMADYPAAVPHPTFDPGDPAAIVGTGAYTLAELEVGQRAVFERRESWWGTEVHGGPYLDRIEFLDYGTDPASWLAAAEAGELDILYETTGEFIEVFDTIGWEKSDVVTSATLTVRFNQLAEVDGIRPYADPRVRRALIMATDNELVLELGYSGLGAPAENHHVAPIHPEYAEIPNIPHDPDGARALLEEAGMADFEHELVSIDDDWRRNSSDAVAAQLRDAGIPVRRVVAPGSTFWNNWLQYPFSSTNWNHRPLAVQILNLAYRSGVPWNETGFSSEEFDRVLDAALSVADADQRREHARRLEEIMLEEAVTIQPYWRALYRHMRPGIIGADMHISFEVHPTKIGFDA
ncbi:diguanylate cyclase [Rhodosalinus halophilus]|uniref:Diguanylate cyclase n=1 Tax=Rhodosalinus halophilus TaxID=2259333 RepID=A0A365U592_9RHOB|nr:ABC transporter substrate-binding protein [Rhodosalinus halophilus]RBI83414.1 diguanylate cyclase [Rhodosalinus halophilus]